MMRLVVVLVGMLLLPTTSIGAVATPGPVDDSSAGLVDEPVVTVSVTVSRLNETTVAYRFSFDVPRRVDEYSVRFYAGHVVEKTGFDVEGSSRLLSWSGGRQPTATVVSRLDERPADRCLCVVTDRWLVSHPIRVEFTTVVGGARRRAHLTDWFGGPTADATIAVEDGRFSPGVVYLGPTENRSTTLDDGRRIRVVTPRGSGQLDPTSVLDDLRRGAETVDLTAGAAPSSTIVVVPHVEDTSNGSRGLMARGVTWSHGYAFVDGATSTSTWFHEYVHTQENYSTTPSMDWYTEATAEYYGRLVAARLDGKSATSVATTFRTTETSSDVLAKRGTWTSNHVPYNQGSRTVAYLDWRIRVATDGANGFDDVYRRLNGRTGLTVAELKDAVAAVVGTRTLDDEIDRFVTTADTPGMDWGPETTGPSTRDTQSPVRSRSTETGDGPSMSATASAGSLVAVLLLTLLLVRRQ